MKPLTEDQLSMLLSEVEVWGPVSMDDLEVTSEQATVCRVAAAMKTTLDDVLDGLRRVGLVPCGFCFGTGSVNGFAWNDTDGHGYRRRFICRHCDGTGRAT